MPGSARGARRTPVVRSVRRWWPFTAGGRLVLTAGVLLVLGEIVGEGAATWLFKVLTDDVLAPRDFAPFPRIAVLYLSLTVLTTLVSYNSNVLLATAGERFIRAVRTVSFGNLVRLSPRFFADHPNGDLLSRLDGDVEAIEVLAVSGVAVALDAAVRVMGFGAMLFVLDVRLALVTAVGAPLLWWAGRSISGHLDRAATRSRQARGRLLDVAEQVLSDVPVVQAYVRQRQETARFERAAREAEVAGVATVRTAGLATPIVQTLQMMSLMAVIGAGAWELAHDQLSLGGLLAFMAYLNQLYEPLTTLAGLAATLGSAAASARRLTEILDATPDVTDAPGALAHPTAYGVLELADVTFTYPGASHPALREVSLGLRPGRFIGIVGPSGSGKSTLAQLLVRLYDPDRGEIRLDGQPLPLWRLDDVRTHVTLVPQQTTLSEGSVREAILWGQEADSAVYQGALDTADVARVRAGQAQGLDADTGQQGRALSGGERQRVALARGLVRDSAVLVLDEPTAALDPVSEERVLERLRLGSAGRATLVITHRLASVRQADGIYVMEAGRIVQHGTHDELLAVEGLYRRLWETQTTDGKAVDDALVLPGID